MSALAPGHPGRSLGVAFAGVNLQRSVQRAVTGAHRRVFDLTNGRLAGADRVIPVVILEPS